MGKKRTRATAQGASKKALDLLTKRIDQLSEFTRQATNTAHRAFIVSRYAAMRAEDLAPGYRVLCDWQEWEVRSVVPHDGLCVIVTLNPPMGVSYGVSIGSISELGGRNTPEPIQEKFWKSQMLMVRCWTGRADP